MNKRQSWNIILLFLILIYGFTAATFIKPESTFSEKENRALATTPEVELDSILSGSFERRYEDSLTDQFPLRDLWIMIRTKAERISGKQDIHDVYFAKSGYLIEKHTGIFGSETARNNAETLRNFAGWVSQTFTKEHFSVMMIPNAVDLLHDFLPPYADPGGGLEYIGRIGASMPDGVFFRADEVLNAHLEEQLYYRTDHHWTTKAAFLVLQSWAASKGYAGIREEDFVQEVLSDSFEGTVSAKVGTDGIQDRIVAYKPDEKLIYKVRTGPEEEGSYTFLDRTCLDRRDQYAAFFGGNYALVQTKTGVKNGRKILVIKDSYANCFVPMLFPMFEEVDMVDLRYFTQSLREFIDGSDYTDILVLYNAAGFAEETTVIRMNS